MYNMFELCVLVWQVVYIRGAGATDKGNDAWPTGRSHGFYRKPDTQTETKRLSDINLYCHL